MSEYTIEIKGNDGKHLYHCDNPKSAILLMCVIAEHQGIGITEIEYARIDGPSVIESGNPFSLQACSNNFTPDTPVFVVISLLLVSVLTGVVNLYKYPSNSLSSVMITGFQS